MYFFLKLEMNSLAILSAKIQKNTDFPRFKIQKKLHFSHFFVTLSFPDFLKRKMAFYSSVY